MYYNDRRVSDRSPSRVPTDSGTAQGGNSQMRITPNINMASPLSPTVPIGSEAGPLPMVRQGPPPITAVDYIPGYLSTLIGKNVRAEFILGTNQFVDRTGRLTDVGVNYFVLEDVFSNNKVMCDLYSVKFVTIMNP